MIKRTLTFLSCLLFYLVSLWLPAYGCTLFAAAGSRVQSGGVLLAKVRDEQLDHSQELRMLRPKQGYRYVGLYAVGGDNPGLKCGVNECGLAVVTATAGAIPSEKRKTMPHTKGLTAKLLTNCDSVDSALRQTSLFVGPQFVILADRTKIAQVEIAPESKIDVIVTDNGVLAHTNHYLSPALQWANDKKSKSSTTRFLRINELLNSKPSLVFDDFKAFCFDRNAGVDDSIFRVGKSESSSRTRAITVIRLSDNASPDIMYWISNVGKTDRVLRFSMDDALNGKIAL